MLSLTSRQVQVVVVALALTAAGGLLLHQGSRAPISQPDRSLDPTDLTQETPGGVDQSVARRPKPLSTADLDRRYVPDRYALAAGTPIPEAGSWDELAQRLPVADRELALAFAERYAGAFETTTPEQLAWMAEHGFPLPEEIARAEAMSDDWLLDLAERGSGKAALLGFDRFARQAHELRQGERSLETERQAVDADVRSQRSEELAFASCSPFAGWIHARRLGSIYGPSPGVLAALAYSVAFGDWRARRAQLSVLAEMGINDPQQQRVIIHTAAMAASMPVPAIPRGCATTTGRRLPNEYGAR